MTNDHIKAIDDFESRVAVYREKLVPLQQEIEHIENLIEDEKHTLVHRLQQTREQMIKLAKQKEPA